MTSEIVLLVFLRIVVACRFTLPNVQLVAQLTATPSTFEAFNIPLFDDSDCSYLVPARPVEPDGKF